MKPFLFIDVDGVLNNRAAPGRYSILGYTVRLNSEDGRRLLELQDKYELVWATTWKDLANVHIAPKIGLPELPWIEWSVDYPTYRNYPSNVMVKTEEVIKYADGRPFVWLDDDLDLQDRELIKKNNGLPILVSDKTGITDEQYELIRIYEF